MMKITLLQSAKALFDLIDAESSKTDVQVKVFGSMVKLWKMGQDVEVEIRKVAGKKKTEVLFQLVPIGGKNSVISDLDYFVDISEVLSSYPQMEIFQIHSAMAFGVLHVKKPSKRLKDQLGICATCYNKGKHETQVVDMHLERYAYQHIFDPFDEIIYDKKLIPVGKMLFHARYECLKVPLILPSCTKKHHKKGVFG